MDNSKKVNRVIGYLDEIEDLLEFYSNGKYPLKKEIKEIRTLIEDLALDRKEDHARFARKLKSIWKNSEK